MPDLISVLVATYERPDALDAVLRSLAAQSDQNFEIVVADDGSGPSIVAVVKQWTTHFGDRLSHVWQPQIGFRSAEVRNRAVLASRGNYCIFLDADCLTRPDFIASHRRLAEPGWFVGGNRILLSPELTERLLRDRLEAEHWTLATWIAEWRNDGLNRLLPALRLPLGPLRKVQPKAWSRARGCNVGIWRADIDRVDGFDGAFFGWGREDSDMFIRLMRAGVRRKDGSFATGVLHLWHAPTDRSHLATNQRRLEGILESDRIRAERGLSVIGREEQRAS